MLDYKIIFIDDRLIFPDDFDAFHQGLIDERLDEISRLSGYPDSVDRKNYWIAENIRHELALESDDMAFDIFAKFLEGEFKTDIPLSGIILEILKDLPKNEEGHYIQSVGWGDIPRKAALKLGRQAVDLMQSLADHARDRHYNSADGSEMAIGYLGQHRRECVEWMLRVSGVSQFQAHYPTVCDDQRNCKDPRTALEALGEYADWPTGEVMPENCLFITSDQPSCEWAKAGIAQLVLSGDSRAGRSFDNVIYAESFEHIKRMIVARNENGSVPRMIPYRQIDLDIFDLH